MDDKSRAEATQLLTAISSGGEGAAARLFPVVYDQLHALADAYFRRQPSDHTLQPTALVHEAFLKLIDQSTSNFKDRSHFLAVAATAMRQILVDRARRRGRIKHGGGGKRVAFDEAAIPAEQSDVDVLALDEALSHIAKLDERKARVVELRFFGGLSIEETAEALGIARATVTEDWRFARAWVIRQMRAGD